MAEDQDKAKEKVGKAIAGVAPSERTQNAIDRFTTYGSAALDSKRRIALGDPRFLPFYIPQTQRGSTGGALPNAGFQTPEPEREEAAEDEAAAGDDATKDAVDDGSGEGCLLYTSPSPRDSCASRMPSSA